MSGQGRDIDTLLARGTRFEGKLTFEGVVRIDGAFSGEIFTDDTLVVGDGAEVDARIEAAVVIVRGGTVRGAIRATESVEVYAPAKVYGDIAAPQVLIERGVFFEGQCRMGPVDRAAEAGGPPVSGETRAS